jgi:hypothetical protein
LKVQTESHFSTISISARWQLSHLITQWNIEYDEMLQPTDDVILSRMPRSHKFKDNLTKHHRALPRTRRIANTLCQHTCGEGERKSAEEKLVPD